MAPRPEVIAFDVIETVFALDKLRPRFADAGLPGETVEIWFARLLRDAFALDATGVYQPFRAVAEAALTGCFEDHLGHAPEATAIARVIDGFAELDAHPDVAPALARLAAAGIPAVALTNGNAAITRGLFERAGLAARLARIVSIDEVRRWKPSALVYRHCADVAGVAPDRLALVAVHPWDVHGAKMAGLAGGFVARGGASFPSIMRAPDVTGATLVEVVDQLVAG